jgi:glyceraldehyde-3-phosphate dehydrogenase/erythrose-4-phosphate dehydrogenase
MSKPIFQTSVVCSMANVTTMACRVPTKQMSMVRVSGALYLVSVGP